MFLRLLLMGYSQSSLAILGKSADSVLDTLKLHRTGEREEFPESPLVAATLLNGWFLLVADRAEHSLIRDNTLRQLSIGCEIVTCTVEEHVMFSEATCWRDGHQVWRVTHSAHLGIEHLETQGELPPIFGDIRDRLCSKQQVAGGPKAGFDCIFDIPVELARMLTGYRYSKNIDGSNDHPFETLTKTSASDGSSFWKRLFGA